jgi:hypothetical protein
MVTQCGHIALSFQAQWLPYGLPGFNFQTFYILPTEGLFVSTWISKQTVVSSPHGINWFLFFPRTGIFTGPYVLSRFTTMCGTRGAELYTTSYLRRCFCTAFACRPRARVSNVMIATHYSIDTYIITHEIWQRKCRIVATLLRIDPHYVRPQQLELPDVTVWPRSKRKRIFWMLGHHLTCYADRDALSLCGSTWISSGMHIRKQTRYAERTTPGIRHIRLQLVAGHTLNLNRGRNRISCCQTAKISTYVGKSLWSLCC